MRKSALLLAAVGGAAYVLGRAQRPSDHRYTVYQRAALLWTDPRAVSARRRIKRATRRIGR